MYDLAVSDSRLKFNEKNNPAGRFFEAISQLIRLHEEGLEKTPEWQKARNSPCLSTASSQVMDVLKACSQSVTVLGSDVISLEDSYCLVEIDTDVQTLTVDKFSADEALRAYFQREAQADSAHNVVLVKGASIEQLQKVYPNYFSDITPFVSFVEELALR